MLTSVIKTGLILPITLHLYLMTLYLPILRIFELLFYILQNLSLHR